MKNFGLGTIDVQKIGKGLLIALIGAALTYLTPVVTHISFGIYTPVAYALWSTIANTVWKLVDGQIN